MIEIERCRLSYQCIQRWEALEHLPDNPRVRFCGECQSAVHLVELDSELRELARQGKCVAIQRVDSETVVGIPPGRAPAAMSKCSTRGRVKMLHPWRL
jgi:hypothetical protein